MRTILLALALSVGFASLVSAEDLPFHRGFNISEWFQSHGAGEIPFSKFSAQDFEQMKAMGVDGIRLPVSFSNYTGSAPAYQLDPRFLALFDRALDTIQKAGLSVVIDNHSDFTGPLLNDRDRFLRALWTQLAQRYRDRPASVLFEIQNEPHDISDGDWARSQKQALAAIRAIDTGRTVVLTGARWGGIDGLLKLTPLDDAHVVYSFHFYEPMVFTHQGAEWAGEKGLSGVPYPPQKDAKPQIDPSMASWLKRDVRTFLNGKGEADLASRIDLVSHWASQHHVSVWCGEMGVYRNYAAPADRVHWYHDVRTLLDERHIPWTAWDYHSSFGIFLKDTPELFDSNVNIPMIEALGLTPPAQSTPHSTVIQTTTPLYDDSWSPETRESSWVNGGSADFYNPDKPHSGTASLAFGNWKRYGNVAWDLAPYWDLTQVVQKASLTLWMRSNAPKFQIELRFVDGSGGDGLPWRLMTTIDQTLVPGDGQWHQVIVPLASMRVTGSWNGTWHEPQKDSFSWDRVGRLEFVSENTDLKGITLGVDDLALTVTP